MMPCFLLLVIVVPVGVLVAALVFGRRGRHVRDPACGKCGYAVKGLPTFTCPECGADLREVGIITAGQSGMSPALWAAVMVLLWTLVLPIPAGVLSVLVLRMAPQRNEVGIQQTLGDPVSKAYQHVKINHVTIVSDGRTISNQLTLTLLPTQGMPSQIDVDLASFGFSYRKKSGEEVKASTGFDANTILDWLSQAGVDRQNQQIKLEADEIFSVAWSASQAASGNQNTSRSVQHFRSQGSSSYSTSMPPKVLMAGVAVFWLVVWLLGCWKLWRIGVRQ